MTYAMSETKNEVADSLRNLVVGTMCHCDDHTEDGLPGEDCYDHWQFFIVDDPDSVPEHGHVGMGHTLDEAQMRYMASLTVRAALAADRGEA